MKRSRIQGKVVFLVAPPAICGLLVAALLERGAAKVYAALSASGTTPELVEAHHKKFVPALFDVFSEGGIAASVGRYRDISVLLNFLSPTEQPYKLPQNKSIPLALSLAFAPIIAANGGGLIVNACAQASLLGLQLRAICAGALTARNIAIVSVECDVLQREIQQPHDAQPQTVIASLLDTLERWGGNENARLG